MTVLRANVVKEDPDSSRVRVLLATLVVVLVVAGCVGPEATAPSPGPRRAISAVERVATPDPAQLVSNVTVEFNRTGEGGTWYMAFLEFPASSGSISFRYNFTFRAEAPTDGPNAVLAFTPAPVQEGGGGWLPGFFNRPVTRYSTSGDSVEIARAAGGSYSSGGRQMMGIMFAVASTGPWTLQGNVTMREGAEFSKVQEAVGAGMEIFLGSTPSTPGGTGTLTLDAEIPRGGWSHYQVFHTPVQPIGVRDQTVAFPDGRTFAQTSNLAGYFVPMAGGSAFGAFPGAIGTFRGAAGAFHAEVTYAEASTGLRQVLFHVSMEEGQAAGAGSGYYEGTADPFFGNCFGC